MTYICCYDISSAKIRGKIAKFLAGYAIRIQKSFFVMEATENELCIILSFVKNMIERSDSFYLIPVCKECQKYNMFYGKNPFFQSKGFMVL